MGRETVQQSNQTVFVQTNNHILLANTHSTNENQNADKHFLTLEDGLIGLRCKISAEIHKINVKIVPFSLILRQQRLPATPLFGPYHLRNANSHSVGRNHYAFTGARERPVVSRCQVPRCLISLQ